MGSPVRAAMDTPSALAKSAIACWPARRYSTGNGPMSKGLRTSPSRVWSYPAPVRTTPPSVAWT